MAQTLQQKMKDFPRSSGVYLFRNTQNVVLYVGKATSLRDRVRQYFSGQEEKSRGPRMRLLLEQTVDVDIRLTDTVLEALILEAELIKKYQPKYNVEGKDGKSFCYFVMTHEEFPRVIILRETDFTKDQYNKPLYKKGKVFGPYTSKEQMTVALKIIRRIFPFHNRKEDTEKGCLSYQIGLCPGPYDGAIAPTQYRRHMRNISLFLTGHKKKLLAKLEVEMRALAKKEEFEAAQTIKRQIFSLTHINDIALMTRDKSIGSDMRETHTRLEAYDISHISGEYTVASMVVFINGVAETSAYRKFKVKAVEGINDVGAMREILARRLNHLTDWGVPHAIILDGGQGHLNMGEKLFADFGVDTSIGLIAVAKGPTRKKVDIYQSQKYPVSEIILKDKDLLEALREEAHRFAITYHKALRDKRMI